MADGDLDDGSENSATWNTKISARSPGCSRSRHLLGDLRCKNHPARHTWLGHLWYEEKSMDTHPQILNTPAAKPLFDEPGELPKGTVVDRFIVLKTLGVGGMGVVYAAHDPELGRKVALKLLLPGAGGSGDADRTRLVREGQALAKLSHPNVVAVHDVGVHDDRVWIAMEFVAGQTLAAWAKERPRRCSEILAMLVDVARGIAAAHGAGLVHRDLKPDNVMIDRDGRVRVMDFGLAHGRSGVSMTESDLASTLVSGTNTPPELTQLGLRLTAEGAVQGTPAYMAPEQWQGQAEAPTTDQFGWSVMAWELLYGERPFAGETKVALAKAVQAGHRRPPPNGRGVPGWLRRVIERGLATKPAERWPTMVALLSALERGKTRARVRMGVVALAGVALLGAGVAGYRRWDIAQRVGVCETRGAEIGRAWNDDARQQLRDAFKATGVSYAATSAEKVMPWLDKQAGAWKDARTEVCLNADVRGAWNTDLADRAMWCLEDRQMEIESLVAEMVRAEASVVQKSVTAVASLRLVGDCLDEGMLLRQPPPPAEGREAIQDVRASLSRVQSLSLTGKYKEALALATQTSEQTVLLGWGPIRARARALEGEMLKKTGEYDDAEVVSTEAYFQAARTGTWDVAAQASIDLIYLVGYERARHADGRAWAQHAAVALVYAGDPAGLLEAYRLSNLASIYNATGSYAEARALQERILSIRESTLGPDHPVFSISLNNLANVHTNLGVYTEALVLFERALAIDERALGLDHPTVAGSLNNLGIVHLTMGSYAKARTLLERALAIAQHSLGPHHTKVAASMSNLARVHIATGAHIEARTLLEHSLAIDERALGPLHPAIAMDLKDLAAVHKFTGDFSEARTLYRRALDIEEKALGAAHPDLASTLNDLAIVEKATGALEDARKLFERALSIKEKALGPAHPDVAAVLYNLAGLYHVTGEFARALKTHESALAIWEPTLGPVHPKVALSLGTIATMHLGEQRPQDALPLLERALTIFDAHEGVQKAEWRAHFDLARALVGTNGDPLLALLEAKNALDGLRKADPIESDLIIEVEQWLAEHTQQLTTRAAISAHGTDSR